MFAQEGEGHGWVRASLRRGLRAQHILYRQQQEHVKHMMIVAINTTKTVTPMAMVAPNLPKSQCNHLLVFPMTGHPHIVTCSQGDPFWQKTLKKLPSYSV